MPAVVQCLLIRMVGIDPENLRTERREVLADPVFIGVARAVAAPDIHHAVNAKGHVAAVVAVRIPFDDHRGRVAMKRVGGLAVDRVPGDSGSLATVLRHPSVGAVHAVGANKHIAVVSKLRMKRYRIVNRRVIGRDQYLRLEVGLVIPHSHQRRGPIG